MVTLLQGKNEALAELCRRFNVGRLELFGSACTAEFDADSSDLDFLVEFPTGHDLGPWMSRLFELQAKMSALLGRRVDLVMTSALRDPWFRRQADKTRTLVFEASHVDA
ncbi:MAG: nucleotidyltransferase domain-containing protein [Verrucomicrobia bacterium]|nr:nucleotidyltransferase domain-containing protein [Verrucomicrobiota bacterium]